MKISIVVPVYNELDNVRILHDELSSILAVMFPDDDASSWEIVFVDDGSTDGTVERLAELCKSDERTKLVKFRRNYGQTAALQAGFDHASGEIIVTLDGDLQNDPADIPRMVAKLDEGFDLIHGWRKNRQDKWLTRRLPSKVANWIISSVTGVPINDLGCTLKAIRREIAEELELYGEMHRFIPILGYERGARIAELVTNHRPRRFGESKYGLSRTVRVVLDLLTVKFMSDYLASPMKLFGRLGLGCWAVAGLSLSATVLMKLVSAVDMTGNPMLLLAVLSAMAGLQLVSLGILGELNTRIYFDRHRRRPYTTDRLVGFDGSESGHQRNAATVAKVA